MAPAFAGASKDEDHIINLGNWLEPENNVWAFQNTSAILPSLVISRGTTPTSPLEYAPVNLDTFEYKGIVDGKRTRMTFTEYLERSDTDAILVMRNGKIVFERYFNGMQPHTRHLMMSVTKSLTGTVAAMLVQEGKLDPSAKVASYIPDLAGTPVGAATVRQTLDMTTGLAYSEDYDDPDADVWSYGRSVGLLEAPKDYAGPQNIKEYLKQMRRAEEPGAVFEYVTPATEVVAWLIRVVEGKSLAESFSDRLWSQIGAEHDALIATERANKAVGGSGLQATARDLARLGQAMLQRGRFNGRQMFDPSLVEGFIKGGDRKAFKAYASEGSLKGFSYKDQWWVTHNENSAFTAMGIYGQLLYIDPTASMVVVKQSSQDSAVPEFVDANDFLVMLALAKHLEN
jgi:CubicO group peptidase (beta-lactamase class C family)